MKIGHTYFKRAVVVTLLYAVLAAMPSRAADDAPVHVQIEAMALPAVSSKGYVGRATITPYVTVKGADAFQRLCTRLPRFRDAILQAFETKPVELADPDADLATRQDVLRESIESQLGVRLFEAMYLVRGSKQPGENSRLVSLPGATRECQAIAYLPWTRPNAAASATTESAPQYTPLGRTLSEAARSLPADDPFAADAQLSDEELLKKLAGESQTSFPGAPIRVESKSWIVPALVVMGLAGVMLLLGSYIGFQIAQIRRDRRRRDRRKKRKDRRSGLERRLRNAGLPEGIEERRGGADRRGGDDRRTGDRRTGPRSSKRD
jgi:hypothetical protein